MIFPSALIFHFSFSNALCSECVWPYETAWVYSFFFCVGCLQSVYGIHTFRVESIAHGKASRVDDLQVQGISNPGLLRKVGLYSSVDSCTITILYSRVRRDAHLLHFNQIIVREASKVIQDFGRSWNRTSITAEGESFLSMEGPTVLKSPSKGLKVWYGLCFWLLLVLRLLFFFPSSYPPKFSVLNQGKYRPVALPEVCQLVC